MMKPDTPKFAKIQPMPSTRIMAWGRQIEAELYFIQEKQKHGGLKAAEMQTTILTERYAKLLEFALRGIKADLAAPKPDCVGVEELRLKIVRLCVGDGNDISPRDKDDRTFLHGVNCAFHHMRELGLLAVKEKAQQDSSGAVGVPVDLNAPFTEGRSRIERIRLADGDTTHRTDANEKAQESADDTPHAWCCHKCRQWVALPSSPRPNCNKCKQPMDAADEDCVGAYDMHIAEKAQERGKTK